MADHAAVIEAARQLGDISRGGDAQLWTEVLEYFGSQDWDCSAQVMHAWLTYAELWTASLSWNECM